MSSHILIAPSAPHALQGRRDASVRINLSAALHFCKGYQKSARGGEELSRFLGTTADIRLPADDAESCLILPTITANPDCRQFPICHSRICSTVWSSIK